MDVRPSELDPYPRTERDLGSAVLWERSLHRSHRRRIRQAQARRNAPRRNGAALAAGAAILAAPTLSQVTGASASSARPGVTKAEIADKAAVSGSQTWLLSYGDTGEAVAAVQYQLQIPADGIFGPQTEGAVKSFQRLQGLAATGIVDAHTWAELFGSKVLFYDESEASGPAPSAPAPSASASIAPAGEKVNVVFGGEPTAAAAGEPAGELADGVDVGDEVSGEAAPDDGAAPAPESDPAPKSDAAPESDAAPDSDAAPESDAAPAPAEPVESTPVSTGGDGCSADGRMVAPVNGTVTGGFGEDRGDHAHAGTDIAAPSGTTVRSAECGTVSVSGSQSGYGLMVCVRHAGGLTTCYAHLSEQSVAVNEYVRAGQKIGEVGCTGSCTGPHVHFEVRQNDTATDPSPYLRGSRTVSGRQATATTAMPVGEGGIGGATPEEQAAVFGNGSGGAEAPAPTPPRPRTARPCRPRQRRRPRPPRRSPKHPPRSPRHLRRSRKPRPSRKRPRPSPRRPPRSPKRPRPWPRHPPRSPKRPRRWPRHPPRSPKPLRRGRGARPGRRGPCAGG